MYCTSCGQKIPDDSLFCPECGTAIDQRESQKVEYYSDVEVVEECETRDRNMAIISYITWIGFIVALISNSRDSEFTKFHLNQALILNLATIVCSFIPLVGWILDIILFVFWIMAIVSAVNYTEKPLPIIGNIKIIK